MFNQERQFNIISGEKNNFISQRSRSCVEKAQLFLSKNQKDDAKQHQMGKLGHSKDRKQFQYSYVGQHLPRSSSQMQSKTAKTLTRQATALPQVSSSLVNYVSTDYNIITHGEQCKTAKIITSAMWLQKMNEVNRKNPLTELIHRGRLLAPNYHQDYSQREKNKEFVRKRGLCESICNIQKGYGGGKYFRKFK